MRRPHSGLSRDFFISFLVKAAAQAAKPAPMSDMLAVITGDLDVAATSALPCASPKGDDK
ncbi:hypothetical protein CH281_11970 [Rhodococcus sp. 06-221-2]|nr:hypothetical protein CH281_11970 [Rhodococcus sp. 06-221-2]